jgi:hypothetical protein
MTKQTRKQLSWLAITAAFVCSIVLVASAFAAAHHASTGEANAIEIHTSR